MRMIQDRKLSEAEPFGEVEHKFRVQTAEFQYSYHYEFAFLHIGAGGFDTSLQLGAGKQEIASTL
jgi:hypothetical protein